MTSAHRAPPDAAELAARLLSEDGPRDITTELLERSSSPCTSRIIVREPSLVVAGVGYAQAIAAAAGCGTTTWHRSDGEGCTAGAAVGTVAGQLSAVLRAERPMLNVLQRACGIASLTRRFVEAVDGTACRILHTRKTAPGLRRFDVAAVLAGGGMTHRMGLDQALMIKDNHWQSMSDPESELPGVCDRARRAGVEAIQIEVEDEQHVALACAAGASRLLVDNQPPARFRDLVEHAHALAPDVEIEATGGITLHNVRAYADAGADYVSVGALTHSVQAADLSLELD